MRQVMEGVMAKVIEFYVPDCFGKTVSIARTEPAKLIEFRSPRGKELAMQFRESASLNPSTKESGIPNVDFLHMSGRCLSHNVLPLALANLQMTIAVRLDVALVMFVLPDRAPIFPTSSCACERVEVDFNGSATFGTDAVHNGRSDI